MLVGCAAQRGDDPFGERRGVLSAGRDAELVSAQAGHERVLARLLLEHGADPAQQQVTGGMAVVLVDLSEVVEVDEQQRALALRGLGIEAIAEGDRGQGLGEVVVIGVPARADE